jgi:hypothetical protein
MNRFDEKLKKNAKRHTNIKKDAKLYLNWGDLSLPRAQI